jgi:endonuclease YncB( thermonuclease family)
MTNPGRGISRTFLWTAALLLLVLFASPLPAEECTGPVVGVADGDTITVLLRGRGEKIRLNGVDCPERGQAYGKRAKQFTSQMVFGRTVTLQTHGRDKYGRLLADVLLPDGASLNRELVRAGYAWWYRKYSDDETLEKLEAEARAEHRGLWADPRPVPPWDYRQDRRK